MCRHTKSTQTHRCGMVPFSQVRLALCILSGGHSTQVWVTANLGAEAGGIDMGGGPPRSNPGWVLGALHCHLRV